MYCFAKFCRLCLKESSVLVDIFDQDKDNGKIVDKMKFLRPELISSFDGLPSWICSSCRTQVNRSYNFSKKWIKSHETLQKYIKKFKMRRSESKNVVLNIDLIGVQSGKVCNYEDSKKNVGEEPQDNNIEEMIDDKLILLVGDHKEEDSFAEKCTVATQTKEPENNINSNSTLQTEDKVIEDLIEIVKMSEDIQNIAEINPENNNESNKTDVLEELIEIAINDNHNSNNVSENIEISNVHSNILEKAIEIAEISECTDTNLQPIKSPAFLVNPTPEGNLDLISETATDTCDSIFSSISNEMYYNTYSEDYLDGNRSSDVFSNLNVQNSVDLDAVRKISGYLQDSYPESPANQLCDLNDKVYNQNCDTIIDDLLQTTTNNETSNFLQTYTLTNATEDSSVQILSLNNSWNNTNVEVLSKEHFALLESVEKNLENLLIRNVQNSDINTAMYTDNYALNCDNVSPVVENVHQSIVDKPEEEPKIISEDGSSSSRKSKLVKKRTNTLEGKFHQLFQDMEIASRHCNTPVECIVSSQNCPITYLVDRNNSVYSCKSCNIVFKSIAAILDHGQHHGTTQDLRENEYLSVNVEKPEKSVKILVNHSIKKFFCKKCDKNYSEFAALYRHVAVHVSNQKYFCDECGKSFPVYRYLSLHKLTHNRIRMYACKLCSKTFRAKDTLKTHEIVHHENNDKPYICELCGKGFVIEQYLKYHMSKHSKETGRICHICGKILKNEELCYKHIKEKHLVISFKECEICHKTFHNNRNLKAHMKFHGTKDFKCDECDKEFFFSRDLKNHKLLHTGSKPHKCEQCGKQFRVLGALYKHRKTHKAKPHVCGVCQRGFNQLRSLQVHERVHSGLKPYKCEECEKSYVHINVYYQHMKKYHPDSMSL